MRLHTVESGLYEEHRQTARHWEQFKEEKNPSAETRRCLTHLFHSHLGGFKFDTGQRLEDRMAHNSPLETLFIDALKEAQKPVGGYRLNKC